MLRQQLDKLPDAPYVSDRRWKKRDPIITGQRLF